MSDGTNLSNFAGNEKEWPVYMTIGNLSSKIRQTPSMHSIVMFTLLPILIKNRNIPQKRMDEQGQTNREVLNEVLRRLLQPPTFKQYPSAGSSNYNVLCADGNFRRCNPVLAAWLADCAEFCDLGRLEGMSVFGANVQRTNLEIMCILTRNTPGGITTYVERSAMPTPRQQMPNSPRAMFT
jgi:hypothetical protein